MTTARRPATKAGTKAGKPRAVKKAQKAEARGYFIKEGVSITGLAEKMGVPAGTLYRWQREDEDGPDDWQRGRAAHLMTHESRDRVALRMIELFTQLHSAAMQQLAHDDKMPALAKVEAISRLADAFSKTMSAASRAAPEVSALSIAQDVLRRIGEHIERHLPHLFEPFAGVLEAVGRDLAAAYA